MRNKLKKFSLAIVTALFFCCAVILGGHLCLNRGAVKNDSVAEAAATTTTVTFAADKTDISPGDTVTLTVTVASTRGSAEWSSINIYAGPLAGDNKTMNAEICKYLKVTTKRASFSPLDYNNLTTDKFSSGAGAFLCVSCSYLGDIEVASTNCVFTIGIQISADAPLLGSFVFGMNATASNNATYNDGSITDKASTGAFAATNTITFNMGAPSNDATLSAVSVGHGTADTALTVADSMEFVTASDNRNNFYVKPTATDAGATITVGTSSNPTAAVNSGASAKVTLSGGVTTVFIKVLAADKTTSQEYQIAVKSNYARLSSLAWSNTTATTGMTKNGLDKTFSRDTQSYTYYIPSDATSVELTPTVAENYGINASIALAKTGSVALPSSAIASGSKLSLNPSTVATGDTITFTVTANGGATYAYTLTFAKVSVNTAINAFTMTGKGQGVTYNSDASQTSSTIDYYFKLPYSSGYEGTFNITLADTKSTVKVGTAAYAPATNYGVGNHTVTVTAEAGNSKVYRVTVVKDIVAADFTSLKFSTTGTSFEDVLASSSYDSATKTFTRKINVSDFGGKTPQIYIGGTMTPEATASVTGGLKANSSTASGEANNWYAGLTIGENRFTVQATSSAGNMIYTFVISYVEEKNAITNITIKQLNDNQAVAGFVFLQSTSSYEVEVPYATNSVTLTVTTDGQYCAVLTEKDGRIERTGNTHTVTRALSVGNNTVKLHAVADEGKGADGTVYTILVKRKAAEKDATLSALTVKDSSTGTPFTFANGEGAPITFSPEVDTYYIVLPEDHKGTLNVTIDATPASNSAKVTGAGQISLGTIVAGQDNAKVLSVTVTPEDPNMPATTYRVVISQKAIVLDNSIELLSLTVTGSDGTDYFSSADKGFAYGNYAITVPFLVERVTIAARAVSSKATLHGVGVKELAVGANVYEVWVSAENGDNLNGAQKYVFTITREKAAEHAWLSDLQINGSQLTGFAPQTYTYYLRETSTTEKVSLRAVAEESRAKVTVSVGGNVICSDFGTAYSNAVALGGKGQTIVLTINVSLDDVTTPYTVNIARASDKPYLTSLNVGGLDIRDVDGNVIDGYNEFVVSSMTDFYVEIVYSQVGSIVIQATSNDSSAELRLPGDDGELKIADLFADDGTISSVQIAVIPVVGEVAVYYVHFTSLTSSTIADIRIEELNRFNQSYSNDRTVYGVYTIDYRLSELITTVNFEVQAGYGVGSYQIYYNDVLKDDNGKEVAGVTLDYGFNYICIDIVSSDKRAKKTVVVLVEREMPYFESISIEEIGGFATDYSKDKTEYFYEVSDKVSSLHFTVNLAGNYRYEVENASELKTGLNQVRVHIYEKDSVAGARSVAFRDGAVRTISINVLRAEAVGFDLWKIVAFALIGVCVILLVVLIIVAARKKSQPTLPPAPIIVTTPAPYVMPQQHDAVTPIIVTTPYMQQPPSQPVQQVQPQAAQQMQQPAVQQAPPVQQAVQQPAVQQVVQQPAVQQAPPVQQVVQPVVQPIVQQPVVQQPVVQQAPPVQQVVQPVVQPIVQQPVVQQPVVQQVPPVQQVVQQPVRQAQPFVPPANLAQGNFTEPQFLQTSPLPQFIETEPTIVVPNAQVAGAKGPVNVEVKITGLSEENVQSVSTVTDANKPQ